MPRRCSIRSNQGGRPPRRGRDTPFFSQWREGRLRGAEAGGPVDGGRAADAAALQDVDRLVAGLARRRFLVQGRVGLGFAHLEVARGFQRAFLDQHHRKAGQRQDFGGDAAAGAAADDGDVGLDAAVGRERGGIGDFPAGRDPCLYRIGDCCCVRRGCGLAHGGASVGKGNRAGVANRRPGAFVAVPGADDQVMQRLVGALQHAETMHAPALQEGRHIRAAWR